MLLTIGKYKVYTESNNYSDNSLHTLVVDLISDGLKMPNNVFGTSQKEKLLKWLSQMQPNGKSDANSDSICKEDEELSSFVCIDMDEDRFLSLVNDVGDVRDSKVNNDQHFATIKAWLDDPMADNFEIVVYLCGNSIVHKVERRAL